MSINRSRYVGIYPMMEIPDMPRGRRIWEITGEIVRKWYDEDKFEWHSPAGITHREILAIGMLVGHTFAALDDEDALITIVAKLAHS